MIKVSCWVKNSPVETPFLQKAAKFAATGLFLAFCHFFTKNAKRF